MVSCILISGIVFLSVWGILSIFTENDMSLTPEQKIQYNKNAGTILIEKQYAAIAHIRRDREWGEAWPYILLVMISGIFGSMIYFLLRYTRPVVTIATQQSDGLNAVTTIPIIAVSIHAPAKGATYKKRSAGSQRIKFQSTRPQRARHL